MNNFCSSSPRCRPFNPCNQVATPPSGLGPRAGGTSGGGRLHREGHRRRREDGPPAEGPGEGGARTVLATGAAAVGPVHGKGEVDRVGDDIN